MYHRLLRLRHDKPRPVMTVLLFEGSIVVSALLSLAEILDWWSVLAVPVAVAALVKFNDIVLGLPQRTPPRQHTPPRPPAARGVARVPERPAS